MKSVLRGVLCGLVWMLAPAAWAQAEDVPVERSQGPVTDVTLFVDEGTRAGEASTRPAVTRSPSRPVVELDAARATGPVETLDAGHLEAREVRSLGPTVDVGSMTTGVQVDREFLRRIAMVGAEMPIRMGPVTEERINDVPEYVDVMSLRNAPLISLRTSWVSRVPASEVMRGPESDASTWSRSAMHRALAFEGQPRGFQSLAELAPGTPEQLLLGLVEEHASRTSMSSITKR
ncbi:hypothetical protein [Myxococcus eversor]|uniref:hypothetical protein n=1 Tax=Myxococcus eversor TaxID=2709661 RepID=UPI0013D51D1B|nr:hypothetical protein [Myxococcus eversor]